MKQMKQVDKLSATLIKEIDQVKMELLRESGEEVTTIVHPGGGNETR